MLAFIGGTGPEGRGLALRLALAGEEIIIGSRDATRAQDAANGLKELAPGATILGDVNAVAAERADTAFVTVPYDGQKPTLEQLVDQLKGKVVVDVVAPLEVTRGRARAIPVEEGSAALQAQVILPESFVVAAFQNISAAELIIPDLAMEGDVVVCSDHQDPKQQVMEYVRHIKDLRPVDGGGIENARYIEDFTAMLLNINRIYRGSHSMIKIVGI